MLRLVSRPALFLGCGLVCRCRRRCSNSSPLAQPRDPHARRLHDVNCDLCVVWKQGFDLPSDAHFAYLIDSGLAENGTIAPTESHPLDAAVTGCQQGRPTSCLSNSFVHALWRMGKSDRSTSHQHSTHGKSWLLNDFLVTR